MPEILAHHLKFVSDLGTAPIIAVLSIALLVLLLVRKRHYGSSIAALLSSASIFYSFFLKQLFKHVRPSGAPKEYYLSFDIYSFPSTHVVFYTTFWGYIFYLTYKFEKDAKILLHIIRWISAYLVISVGASRLFLGVHFFKDIFGGYIFGLLFLILIIWLDKKLDKMFTKNNQ